jgi:hypothetical protein
MGRREQRLPAHLEPKAPPAYPAVSVKAVPGFEDGSPASAHVRPWRNVPM